MAMKTVHDVYRAGLCNSCGLCVGVCPKNAIEYKYTVEGLLKPVVDKKKCVDCTACVRYCPGNCYTEKTNRNNEKCYAIHSLNYETRYHGASGGFVTELLCHLLENHYVDGCVVVPPIKDSLEVVPIITSDVSQIRKARGSKYIPVQYGKILPDIKKSKKRFALVALPCQTEMIKEFFKNALERIFIITLMCNHITGTAGTKMVLGQNRAGRNYSYEYRGNGWPGQVSVNGKTVGEYKKIYHGKFGSFFYPERCRMCDRHIGVYGDVFVADNYCWSAEKNSSGNTLVICDSERVKSILYEMTDKQIIGTEEMDLQNGEVQKRQFSAIYQAELFIPIILSARHALCMKNPEGMGKFQEPDTSAIKNVVMYSGIIKQNIKSRIYSAYINAKYGEIK